MIKFINYVGMCMFAIGVYNIGLYLISSEPIQCTTDTLNIIDTIIKSDTIYVVEELTEESKKTAINLNEEIAYMKTFMDTSSEPTEY